MQLRYAARAALALLLVLAFPATTQSPPLPAARAVARNNAEDFDAMWRAIDERYAYFGQRRGAWKQARDAWRPRAERASSRAELVAAIEGALDQLRDDHVWLSEHTARSPRRIPAEIDIWPVWKGTTATVESVRTFADADVAGVRPGDVIARIDGLPVERLVRDLAAVAGVAPPSVERDWALRRALSGPRSGTLQLEVRAPAGTRAVTIEHREATPANGPLLIARRMGEGRDLGYIRIKASLSDPRIPGQFEGALDYLKDTRALIVDLREAGGAQASAQVEAVLSRFAPATLPWRQREPRGGERTLDTVDPRSPRYAAPVVVLVDRWTSGDGEALAAGLQAVAKARLVGTAMAGLRGEIGTVRLAHSQLVVHFPVERAFHADGTPRELVMPAVAVDLAAPQGGPGDPILYQALKLLDPASSAPAGRSAPR
ncbi:MAG TPA: S41 family peptidase [Usitatibacter sp.]|nr:S41 family peptidase [Usitatibacter sp.]